MKHRSAIGIFLTTIILAAVTTTWAFGPAAVPAPIISIIGSPADTCWADADVNDDGLVLSVADYVHLVRFCQGEDVGLPVPYKADLNGDCMIDYLDVLVYEDYFNRGLPAFAPWGDYPVPTCCDPDTIRGECCMADAYMALSPNNCQAAGGEYWGDGTFYNQSVGDVNDDAAVNIGDGVYLISYFFSGGPPPPYMPNADPNGDCCVDYSDIAFYVCRAELENGLDPVPCTCPDADVCPENLRDPGDANGDGDINVADAVYLIGFVFKGGPDPVPYKIFSGDANNDALVNVGDAVFIIAFVFNGGQAPVGVSDWMLEHRCVDLDGNPMP